MNEWKQTGQPGGGFRSGVSAATPKTVGSGRKRRWDLKLELGETRAPHPQACRCRHDGFWLLAC